jgi:hypothetical protein
VVSVALTDLIPLSVERGRVSAARLGGAALRRSTFNENPYAFDKTDPRDAHVVCTNPVYHVEMKHLPPQPKTCNNGQRAVLSLPT